MAASAKKITTWVPEARNNDQIGRNFVWEFHEVTFNSDKTVEVTTSLAHIWFVLSGPTQDVTDPAANVLGCDKIITTGAVTVSATANNSDTFFVVLVGGY